MRTLRGVLLATLAVLSAGASAATPDASVERQLKQLDLHYEVDEDGDFRIVFETGEDGSRSQLAFVRSPTETFGTIRVREVWSPGYRVESGGFSAAVANRLLEASNSSKLGAWVKQDQYAVFVVKIPADASPEQLRDAIEAAVSSADAMEAELAPGKDVL